MSSINIDPERDKINFNNISITELRYHSNESKLHIIHSVIHARSNYARYRKIYGYKFLTETSGAIYEFQNDRDVNNFKEASSWYKNSREKN